MITVNDALDYICEFAPIETKMEFDNVGFLVGDSKTGVSTILVSLDITHDVITEALDIGAELIVSHHPVFFSLKSVTDKDATGRKVVRLLSGGISAICMHTNLDAARGGVNDTLADVAGITIEPGVDGLLHEDGKFPDGSALSYGRVGHLSAPCPLSEYLKTLKPALNVDAIRFYDAGRDVYRIGFVGGSGGSQFEYAIERGCDTFLSADIKYDTFLDAKELGINIIDADHFCTENVVTKILADKLRIAFTDTKVVESTRHGKTVKVYRDK